MSKLPNDYFLDIDDEMLEYLERHGERCIQEINESNNKNKENGYKLLNLLIVGIGSSFLLFTQKKEFDYLSVILIVFSICWVLCAIHLTWKVLGINKRFLINEPPSFLYTKEYKNLNKEKDYTFFETKGFMSSKNLLSVVRRYRLYSLCETATELGSINKKLRINLRGVTYAAIATPVVSIIISCVYIHCIH